MSELAAALCEELEVEDQFAGCFESCMRPGGGGGGGGGGGRRAVRHAVVVLRRELSSDLDPVVRANQTIDRCSMEMVEALVPLKAAMRKAVGEEEGDGEDALPALQALCTQMADGWCTQLLEVMTANMQQAFKLESWQPLYEGTTHSSSVVDLFTQLDQLTQVYAMFAQQQPLPAASYARFLEVLETQVCQYAAQIVSGCAPLPVSALNGGGGGGDEELPQPAARVEALELQSAQQLCLRLNNVEWAGGQLLALAGRLRNTLPALAGLPSAAMPAGVQACEAACSDMADYIASKLVFYELEAPLLQRLYVPRPGAPGARLGPVLQQLQPRLQTITAAAAPRWTQQLAIGILGRVALAIAAVLDLPGRAITPADKPTLRDDIEALIAFFARTFVMEEALLRQSVTFLFMLADSRCDGE